MLKANMPVKEAAERLGISTELLRFRIKKGQYPEFASNSTISDRGTLYTRINRKQFEHYCEENHY